MADKLHGLRRGNTKKQVHAQIRIAADALLAVMHLLQQETVKLTEEGRQYLDATERRSIWIKERLKNAAAEGGEDG